MVYTVGEMAKLLGVPTSTLRYYDKEGLLPFVERSPGGMRLFQDKDYEWLQIINCLKKTGMPLKDIRIYIDLAMQGDSTIDDRLKLILKQREAVQAQMADLQKTLDTLDFKCWYYKMARQAGTTSVPRNMPLEEVPEQYRAARITLRELPKSE